MKALLIQHDIAWENKAANFPHVREVVARAEPERGSLLVLPEMFATGFSLDLAVTVEAEGGETENFLASLAQETGCCVVGGLVQRGADGRARNRSLAIAPDGRVLARYSKLRPFSHGGELSCHAPGDDVPVFEWAGARVAMLVCYDLRFPEVSRLAALARVEVLTFIASWPVGRIHHWVRLLQARAIEGQCYVVGVNRTGTDPSLRYCGRSVVADFHGELLADAGETEGAAGATLDLPALRDYRRALPFLDDLR